MQWDHLPGTVKLGEISDEMRARSRKLIFEELAKCELVCANCHAIRTYKRLREGLRGVAQLVECSVWDAEVTGSSPVTPTD